MEPLSTDGWTEVVSTWHVCVTEVLPKTETGLNQDKLKWSQTSHVTTSVCDPTELHCCGYDDAWKKHQNVTIITIHHRIGSLL